MLEIEARAAVLLLFISYISLTASELAPFGRLQGETSVRFVPNAPRVEPAASDISAVFGRGTFRPSYNSLNQLHVAWSYLIAHDLADASGNGNSSRPSAPSPLSGCVRIDRDTDLPADQLNISQTCQTAGIFNFNSSHVALETGGQLQAILRATSNLGEVSERGLLDASVSY